MAYDYEKNETLIELAKAYVEREKFATLYKNESNTGKQLDHLDKMKKAKTRIESLQEKYYKENPPSHKWVDLKFHIQDREDFEENMYKLNETTLEDDFEVECQPEGFWIFGVNHDENNSDVKNVTEEVMYHFKEHLVIKDNAPVVDVYEQELCPFEGYFEASLYLQKFGLMQGQEIVRRDITIKTKNGTVIQSVVHEIAIPLGFEEDADARMQHILKQTEVLKKQMIEELLVFEVTTLENSKFTCEICGSDCDSYIYDEDRDVDVGECCQ